MPNIQTGFITDFIHDSAGNITAIQNVDSSITRLAKTQVSTNRVRVVAVNALFTSVTLSNTGGLVTLTSAGVHSITAANVVVAGETNVYITWSGTGKFGVNGLYVVNAVPTTTSFTINLPWVSSTVTFTIANAVYSASTLYRLGDLVTYSGSLYVCNVASSFGRTAPDFGEDFVLADSSRNGGIVNWTAHGRSVNDPITLSTSGTLPTALPAGLYYVKRIIDANRFTLSSTVGGAEIVITDVGTPTNTATLFYGSSATVTGISTDINLAEVPIAGNTVTNKGSLAIDALFTSSTTGSKIYKVGYGVVGNMYTATQTANLSVCFSKIAYRRGSTLVTTALTVSGHTIGTAANIVVSVDPSTNQSVLFTGQMGVVNEVMTLEAYIVEAD